MSEHGEGPPQSRQEAELPPAELKETVTRLRNSFKDAFKKSKELPLWHLVPVMGRLDAYVHEYAIENEKWTVNDGFAALSISRDRRTENGIETEKIDLRNDKLATWLDYTKVTPDENDPNKPRKFEASNTPLAVEMMEKMISELPQYKD